MSYSIHPSKRPLIAIGVLLAGVGTMICPAFQIRVVAQPPENPTVASDNLQATGIPQPLATPLSSSSSPDDDAISSARTTRAVGTLTGQGTVGNIAKFTGTNAIGNSVMFENGGKVGIGTTTPTGLFSVKGTSASIYPIYSLGVGNAILGSSSGGIGIYGQHTNTTGDQSGVSGETSSTSANAAGVMGTSKATSAGAYSAGVRGANLGTGTAGFGVYGSHAGGGIGVYGLSAAGNGVWGESSNGIGMHGRHTSTSGTYPAILGESNSTAANAIGVQGIINSTSPGTDSAGVRGINNSTGGNGYGVYGSQAGSGVGVYGMTPNGNGVIGRSSTSTGVSGVSTSGFGAAGQSTNNYGLYGESTQSYGVYGTASNAAGVYGISSQSYGIYGTSSQGNGVYGTSSQSDGVYGNASNGAGVRGHSGGYSGVRGDSDGGEGVTGTGHIGVVGNANSVGGGTDGVKGVAFSSNSQSAGIEGNDGNGGNGSGYAGYFYGKVFIQGNLSVTGTLSKGAGSFKIDHPLHPSTEYLSHSFVESPDMMNVYNGNTTTNRKGQAWVTLPNYFQALNRDFRYQLTPMGQFAQVIVGQKIKGNRFLIRTDKPNVEVSWQVTGIRNDAYARQHRIRVEETKLGADRGKYLYPAGFGAGPNRQIGLKAPRLAAR